MNQFTILINLSNLYDIGVSIYKSLADVDNDLEFSTFCHHGRVRSD